ncbi:MAG: hypothetical protein PUC30_09390 [Lachnospiraceae bacterium]|nr:hypothetical protein [Lachnospiraceae bacterium]
MLSAKETAEATVNELIRETSLGNSSLLLSYKKEWKGYDTRSVVSRFLKNTEAYLQVEHYMLMYREYEHDLPQEYGMGTKQSVLECKAELLKAEAEYLRCVVEKVRLEFVLEHGIYVDAQK